MLEDALLHRLLFGSAASGLRALTPADDTAQAKLSSQSSISAASVTSAYFWFMS